MPDRDSNGFEDLDRLAPDVDTDAALEQFRRRRTGPTRRRWPVAAAAAVVVALLAVVGVAIWTPDDDAPVATGPTEPSDSSASTEPSDAVTFEVLAVNEAVTEVGTLAAATEDGLAPEFWDQTGSTAPYPEVVFDTTVLVSVTIPDDACPPELTEFQRDGDVLTPVFVEPPGGCIEPFIPKTFVVALARDSVPPVFTLRLPADDVYGFGEQTLTVELDGSPTATVPGVEDVPDQPPPCADIERFADQLVDVGISYDYTPSQSPIEVAERSDVVLSGRLTGGFADEGDNRGRVGYEVTVDTLHRSPANVNLANPLTVYVDVGVVDPADFAATVVPGTPVIVMAEWIDRVGGERLYSDIEGFVTGCPGAPLLGFTGFLGGWADIDDLHGLTKRLATAFPGDG